jgi:hypothetical protein
MFFEEKYEVVQDWTKSGATLYPDKISFTVPVRNSLFFSAYSVFLIFVLTARQRIHELLPSIIFYYAGTNNKYLQAPSSKIERECTQKIYAR